MRLPIICLGMVLTAGVPGASLAGPSKAGLWQQSGYHIESNGRQAPCEAGANCDLQLPDGKDINKVCVGTDMLSPYVQGHVAQSVTIAKIYARNCKAAETTDAVGWHNKMACDELTMTQQITQPDDQHISFETMIEGSTPGEAPVWTRTGGSYVWLGSDCADAGTTIRQLGSGPRQVAPP